MLLEKKVESPKSEPKVQKSKRERLADMADIYAGYVVYLFVLYASIINV
jgi:hypothetical protein